MKTSATAATNRNGVIGNFAEFAPERLSIDQVIARLKNRGKEEEPEGRTSRHLLDVDGYSLVRYRLNSDEMRADTDALGLGPFAVWPEMYDCTAVFGVIDRRTDKVAAVIKTMGEDDDGPQILFAGKADGVGLPGEIMAAVLNHIDVPASRRNGWDLELAARFDLWRDDATGRWGLREPMEAIVVTFKRSNFQTSPVMSESVDVMVPALSGLDLDDPDAERAEEARNRYIALAWEQFRELKQGSLPRPGFETWMYEGDPWKTKMVSENLYEEMAARRASLEAELGIALERQSSAFRS